MGLRPAPKRKTIDYQQLDKLQDEIFGLGKDAENQQETFETELKTPVNESSQINSKSNNLSDVEVTPKIINSKSENSVSDEINLKQSKLTGTTENKIESDEMFGNSLVDLETVAKLIISTKAGQGRSTTRPFSLPRTLIIDTTRLKAKFRTIDEQFTQNVIIDFLLREALAVTTPENYKQLKTNAFEAVKRVEETTRRSLTVTEEVVYQMSELKAGINLTTGKKYSNDEIFSTLLALGISWLYQNNVLI